MDFHIYNTLTRKKELFTPIKKGKASIYSCWPTVYSHQHIGNMRAAFIVDLLRRVLGILWYETSHVMNITDVWHLTGDNEWDANTGEDRMEKWARKEWITAREVADKYTKIYLDDLAFLSIDAWLEKEKHDIFMPRATDHIKEQIDMIKQLEKKWYTYIVEDDGVYMDTSKVKDYWALLSDKHLAWLEVWSRIDLKGKKNSTDFALWKFNMTGKKRDMERESPRGIWFPGRHIECSAMSIKHLGKHFDIHTGWMEHIPVHHTNEIAQSECSSADHPWVNYRVHYQWLMMNGKKIAKSDGNVAFLSDIREKWYTWEDMRMFYLQAHYRSFQDFTWESLKAAQKGRKSLKKKLRDVFGRLVVELQQFSEWIDSLSADDLKKEFTDSFVVNFFDDMLWAITDDLDTVKMMAILNRWLNTIIKDKIDVDTNELLVFLHWLDIHILEIWLFKSDFPTLKLPTKIKSLAQSRRDAKLAKDYAKADELRKELHAAGRDMLDGKDGFEMKKL